LQRAPPVFGWAAITLGISPHSSFFFSIFVTAHYNIACLLACLLYELTLRPESNLICRRYVATELPLRYRKLVANPSKCYKIVAGLWTAALVTFVAPLTTKPDWMYYRYNANQKMCGLHWEYPV